jgi:NAD(P)-dependent dehydrogenase (short-subunit alcohol dehydrogenase family)
VPAELAPTLFERFVRGTGDRGGSFGLGLAIVKAVAESHGGSVALEPTPGAGGARFVVRLPAREQTAGDGAVHPAEADLASEETAARDDGAERPASPEGALPSR